MNELKSELPSFEEVLKEIEILLSIDNDKLEYELLKNPKIYGSLNVLYIRHLREYKDLIDIENQLKLQRYKYYSGKCPAEVYHKEPLRETVLKSDIDKYLSSDKKLIQIRKLIEEQEAILKIIEEGKKSLNYRGMDIKTSFEILKFKLGN